VAVVTMKQLLEAGVHFGHQTRRWNPKMKRFIFGERNGIYIIDLNQTLVRVNTAYSFVRDLVAGGGTVMFVGTKKQTQDPVSEFALTCGMPYVNQRWLGGMLTNFQTVAGRVRKLAELESARDAGDFEAMPKKEALQHQRELEKLQRNLGGIRRLDRPPDAIFVIDTKKEHIAVTEANKLGLPVVAVVDTNCDPDVIDYVIPGNDDAIRAGRLMCRIISDAVAEGRFIAQRRTQIERGGPRVGDTAPVPAPPSPPAGAAPSLAADVAPGAAPAAAAAATATESPSSSDAAPVESVAAAGGEAEEGVSSGSNDPPASAETEGPGTLSPGSNDQTTPGGSAQEPVAPDSANGSPAEDTVDVSVED
jgi:small subunit ribosomal protein S2